jgi:hypothetical protein
MKLPEELEKIFQAELTIYEEARQVKYVTSIERFGIQKGILQDRREAVIEILEVRFDRVTEDIIVQINAIEDIALLKMLHRQAIAIPSLSDFEQLLSQ